MSTVANPTYNGQPLRSLGGEWPHLSRLDTNFRDHAIDLEKRANTALIKYKEHPYSTFAGQIGVLERRAARSLGDNTTAAEIIDWVFKDEPQLQTLIAEQRRIVKLYWERKVNAARRIAQKKIDEERRLAAQLEARREARQEADRAAIKSTEAVASYCEERTKRQEEIIRQKKMADKQAPTKKPAVAEQQYSARRSTYAEAERIFDQRYAERQKQVERDQADIWAQAEREIQAQQSWREAQTYARDYADWEYKGREVQRELELQRENRLREREAASMANGAALPPSEGLAIFNRAAKTTQQVTSYQVAKMAEGASAVAGPSEASNGYTAVSDNEARKWNDKEMRHYIRDLDRYVEANRAFHSAHSPQGTTPQVSGPSHKGKEKEVPVLVGKGKGKEVIRKEDPTSESVRKLVRKIDLVPEQARSVNEQGFMVQARGREPQTPASALDARVLQRENDQMRGDLPHFIKKREYGAPVRIPQEKGCQTEKTAPEKDDKASQQKAAKEQTQSSCKGETCAAKDDDEGEFDDVELVDADEEDKEWWKGDVMRQKQGVWGSLTEKVLGRGYAWKKL